MKVAGEFEVVKYNAVWDEDQQKMVPGEEIERFTAQNNIRSRYFYNFRRNLGMWSASTLNVFISEARNKTEGDYPSIGWAGTAIVNGSYTARNPTDPREPAISFAYYTWRTRFDPPGSGQRDLASIALRSGTTDGDDLAAVGLTEICVQTDSEIIDVFYRLYIDDETISDNDLTPITDIASYRQINDTILTTGAPAANCYYYPYHVGFDWWPAGLGIDSYGQMPSVCNDWLLTAADSANEDWDGIRDDYVALVSTDFVGYQMGSSTTFNDDASPTPGGDAIYGTNRTSNSLVVPPGTTKVQSTFGKLKTSVLAYLDIDNQATGTGSISVTETTPGESWTPFSDHLFAERYRINITTSGDVGTAEYKIVKARWPATGGSPNSTNPLISIPNLPKFRHQQAVGRDYVCGPDGFGDSIRHGVHGPDGLGGNMLTNLMNDDYPFVMEYLWPEFISVGKSYGDPYDATTNDVHGITIYDIKGQFLNVNKFNYPSFVVTDIRQVQIEDDGTIWVACSDTGLWKITRATTGSPAVIDDLSNGTAAIDTITRITTTTGVADNAICRGVQLEHPQSNIAPAGATIWALFDKEMCESSDGGATWTVYNAGSSPPFVITGVTGGGDNASGIMHFVKDHEHATKDRFFIATRANEATTDGHGYWWSTDATDTVSGIATFVDVAANVTGTSHYITNKIIGQRCIYAGSDGDWYFRTNSPTSGIARFAFNGTNDLAENTSTTVSTCVGNGIQVYFDENGDDWIVGYDHTNSSSERVRGKRPQNATSTSTTGSKVLCWRINGSSSNGLYDNWLRGLSCYLGHGIWISYQTDVNYGHLPNTLHNGWALMTFFEDNTGGINSSGVVTDDRIWTEYGWEGSPGAWVEGGTGSKVTHGTTEDLIDGLQIDFTGGSAGAFDDGDMYDTYLYDGIIKDNATTTAHTFYVGSLGSVAGTDYLSGTVPASPVGAVTNEVICPHYVGTGTSDYQGGKPGQYFPTRWNETAQTATYTQFSNVMTGDFTIEFTLNQASRNSTGSYITRYGLSDASLGFSETSNFVGGCIRLDNATTDPNSLTRRYAVSDGTSTVIDGFYDVVTQNTNVSGDDYFLKDETVRVTRSGTTIQWSVKSPNGSYNLIQEYTSISNTLIFGVIHYGHNNQTMANARISYTPSTYHTWIGDGVNTGPGTCVCTIDADDTTINLSAWPDQNFRSSMLSIAGTTNFKMEVDTTGSGNWVERTRTTNIYDTIQNTEYRIYRNGKIEFHADDAGRNIRGRWVYGQQQNLV